LALIFQLLHTARMPPLHGPLSGSARSHHSKAAALPRGVQPVKADASMMTMLL
jgi:hypothetical protein